MGALAKSTKHTKTLLSNLGEMKWIDKTVSLISGRSSDADDGNGRDFTIQGCHPFYEDVIASCQPSIVRIVKELISIYIRFTEFLWRYQIPLKNMVS